MRAKPILKTKNKKYFKNERNITMKKLTKLLALALVLVMALSLATTTFAATIIVDDEDVEGAEYGAYKLLSATDLGDGKFTYAVNETYKAALLTVINSAEALTTALKKLMDSPASVRNMGRAARAAYEARFTAPIFAANLERVYDEILKNKGGSLR
jgi:glycosyltransferase involved in cell wall biosynthesis